MKLCPNCQQQYSDDLIFCPNDGGQLTGGDRFIGMLLEGKYRIEKELGRGGMGTVYRAMNVSIERTVAIKVLNAELVANQQAVERFRREARASGRINHPNAIAVTDFGVTADNTVFLVMEYLEGISLRDHLRKLQDQGKLLAPGEVVKIMTPVCAAVDAAHRKGIIHRDLKPDNIMLQQIENQVVIKVLDFGIAQLKNMGGGAGTQTLTQAGMIVGTPYYMSPEQCHGQELDARSDVYSLGVILYELFTGKLPFTAPTSVGVILKHTSEIPRPPRQLQPSLPPALEVVVLKALEKDANNRQASAAELGSELEAAMTGRLPQLRPTSNTAKLVPQASTQQGTNPAGLPTLVEPIAGFDPSRPTEAIGSSMPTIVDQAGVGATGFETRVGDPNAAPNTYQTVVGAEAAKPVPGRETRMGAAPGTVPMGPGGQVISSEPQVVQPGATFPFTKVLRADKRSRASFYISIGAAVVTIVVVVIAAIAWFKPSQPPVTATVETPASKIPTNMVLIPGGKFIMGRKMDKDVDPHETPEHEQIVKPFYLAKYELTNKEYQEFVIATNRKPPDGWDGTNFPPGEEDFPAVNVSWNDAMDYCKWLVEKTGLPYRLPTEEEWEFAARGTDKREFPWGNTFNPDFTNSAEKKIEKPVPVVKYSDTPSPFKIVNLAGNVSEWTASPMKDYPGSTAKPIEGAEALRIVRGGNFSSPSGELKTTSRFWVKPERKIPSYGFRVAMDEIPDK